MEKWFVFVNLDFSPLANIIFSFHLYYTEVEMSNEVYKQI